MGRILVQTVAIWGALAIAALVPLIAAAQSPLLAWRQPIYVAAGLAGVLGLALMLFQPLLASGRLPGLSAHPSRRAHRWIGGSLVLLVIAHVAGLWITSPPDMIDALLFASPTPFSAWGVIAMWTVFAAALLAALRRRLPLPWRHWRRAHMSLVFVITGTTAAHALLIEGTMEPVTKAILCALVVGVTGATIAARWAGPNRRR